MTDPPLAALDGTADATGFGITDMVGLARTTSVFTDSNMSSTFAADGIGATDAGAGATGRGGAGGTIGRGATGAGVGVVGFGSSNIMCVGYFFPIVSYCAGQYIAFRFEIVAFCVSDCGSGVYEREIGMI
jgi:hypothetical protein